MSPSRLAWPATLGGGLAVALALAWVLCGSSQAPGAPPSPSPPAFAAGARQAYRLSLESALHFAGGQAPGPSAIRQTLAGTLHLRVLEAGPGVARVAFQLDGLRAELQGRSSAELTGQLSRPFVVTFGPDGAPRRFEPPAGVGPEARLVLEEAIRTFQLVVPEGAGATWSTEEEHGAGRYRADYRATRDGRILKAKVAYLRAGPAGADGKASIAVRRSDATARLARGVSWLERMVVEEELTAALGQGLLTRSTLRAELALEPRSPALASELELDAGAGPLAAGGAATAPGPASQGGALAVDAPPRPLDDLVRELDARRGRSASLLYELRRLLLREPATAGQLLARLRGGVADGTAAALLNTLGMAATPEAQAALRAILADPAAGRLDRIRAALALGGGTDVEEESLAALRAAADGPRAEGVADTAVLALGTAAGRLRGDDGERYVAVREELAARARRAGPGEASAALLALGNAGDPALAEVAAARLDDPSPAVRDSAAHALGRLGAGADPDQLARRLAVEPEVAVRGAIAASLAALPSPTATTLALARDALAREPDPEARYALARLVGEHLERFPPGRDALVALSTRDPSRRIRQYAAHAVWGAGP